MVKAYGSSVLTGGGIGALDRAEIDGADLNDLDYAVNNRAQTLSFYWLDVDSAAAEDSPRVIAPDTNPADKRWLLQSLHVRGLTLENDLPVTEGGTGASTAVAALANLGAIASAGVAGGQTVIGGTGAGEDLTLQSTSNATKGSIFIGGSRVEFPDGTNDTGLVFGSLGTAGRGIDATGMGLNRDDLEYIGGTVMFEGNADPEVGNWDGDGVSNGSTTITDVGGGAHGLDIQAGDLAKIIGGGTSADFGDYTVQSTDGTAVVLDRTLAGSDTDLTVTFYKDILLVRATDGTNGMHVLGYSHTNKPLQLGGDTLLSLLYVANTGQSPDIQIGRRLILPQVNEATTPTLAFGDGDTGIFESADDILAFAFVGVNRYTINAANFISKSSFSFQLQRAPGNATLPVYTFVADIDTGISRSADDQMSFIAGGVEIMRLIENGSANMITSGTSHLLRIFRTTVTLDTGDAETDVGLTAGAVIMSAAIRVAGQITGLDSADHHIQLGINGDSNKYIDVAQGSAQTTIDVNVKDSYTFDTTVGLESAALVLTITGGGDNIPAAGAVEVEVIYLDSANLDDV